MWRDAECVNVSTSVRVSASVSVSAHVHVHVHLNVNVDEHVNNTHTPLPLRHLSSSARHLPHKEPKTAPPKRQHLAFTIPTATTECDKISKN